MIEEFQRLGRISEGFQLEQTQCTTMNTQPIVVIEPYKSIFNWTLRRFGNIEGCFIFWSGEI